MNGVHTFMTYMPQFCLKEAFTNSKTLRQNFISLQILENKGHKSHIFFLVRLSLLTYSWSTINACMVDAKLSPSTITFNF